MNIGKRQDGRVHERSVINCAGQTAEIETAFELAGKMDHNVFINPQGDRNAASKIVSVLDILSDFFMPLDKYFSEIQTNLPRIKQVS